MKKKSLSFLYNTSTTGALLGVLTVAFGVIGLLLLQTPLEQPQDLRRQASVENGPVVVRHSVIPENPKVGETTQVLFSINTGGFDTDGVQVLFNVITQSFDTLTADIELGTGLQSGGTQVERTADGFLVQALALPETIGAPFKTTGAISPVFLRVSFVPTRAGTVAFSFDTEESLVIRHDSDPLEDILDHVDPISITIADSPNASPSPSPSVSPSPSPTPGTPVVSCNQVCSKNSQCGVNQRCYADTDGVSRCRLAVNPTNDRCITADTGPNYSCNQGCADTHECSTGLVCWYNKCRNPLNVEQTSCRALTTTQTESLSSSCNASCSSNNDCDINLRCYQGACRLATNPSSSSCSAIVTKTISGRYDAKGGATATTSAGTVQDAADATASGGLTLVAPGESSTAESNGDAGATKDWSEQPVTDDETALDLFLSMMQSPDSALPLIIIGAGVGLLLISLLLLLVRRAFAKKHGTGSGNTLPPTTGGLGGGSTQSTAPQAVSPLTTARAVVAQGAAHQQPQYVPQVQANNYMAPGAPSTPAGQQHQQAAGSSMLERMKAKGITVPTSTNQPTNQP